MAAAPLPVRPVPGVVYDGTLHQMLGGVALVDTRFGRVRAQHSYNGVPQFRQRAVLAYRSGVWYLLNLY
jgi:hypothetical protein